MSDAAAHIASGNTRRKENNGDEWIMAKTFGKVRVVHNWRLAQTLIVAGCARTQHC